MPRDHRSNAQRKVKRFSECPDAGLMTRSSTLSLLSFYPLACALAAPGCDLPGSDDGDSGAATSGSDPGDTGDDDDETDGDDDDDVADDTGDGDGDTDGDDDDDDGPYVADAPSCDGLVTECAGASCCTTIDLPGGVIAVGRSENGNDACPEQFDNGRCFSEEMPEHDVAVDAFALDHYAVTVGRFRQFRKAWDDNWRPMVGDGDNPAVAGSDWQASWSDHLPGSFDLSCHSYATWTDEPGSNEDKPITCVNWYHAQAFCIWDGGRLPTEAEWELAAAGGDQNRVYPWGGADIDETRSVFDSDQIEPVGTKPDGAARWGHLDMAGNTSEWVFDCYDSEFHDTAAASEDNAARVPGSDGEYPCERLHSDTNFDPRVVKGGGSESGFLTYNRVVTRDTEPGGEGSAGRTFRCARNL